MAVPANLAALDTTASNNPPAGTDAVFPELDNHLRFTYSCLAQLRDQKLALTGGTLTGALSVGNLPTIGSVKLDVGTAGLTGFVSFTLASGVRLGYIGSASNRIPLTAEGSAYYSFEGAPPRSTSAAASATELVRKGEMDTAVATKAALAGSASQTFSVATATAPAHAVRLDQLPSAIGGTWQNLVGSRSFGVTYTNSTGKTICVSIWGQTSSATTSLSGSVDGLTVASQGTSFVGITLSMFLVVPNGQTYRFDAVNNTLQGWVELS